MPRISNEDRDANALKLVSIWLEDDEEWLYRWQIRKKAEWLHFDKRRLSRYLEWLSTKEDRVLETDKQEGGRKTKYRPTRDYWKKTFRWIPTRADPDDAEYLYFIELADRLSDVFKKANLRSLATLERSKNKEGKGLSHKDRDKLNDKIATLVRAIRLNLSREYFDRDDEPEAVYALLRGNVRRLVITYTDLWLFLSETYGAKEEFAKQMNSVQRKVARLKQIR